MSDNYVKLQDTISSKEGKGFITINGQNRELFEISTLKAQLDMIVQSRQMLGHRMTQHKVVGAEGAGSATLYFMNSEMLKMAIDFLNSGSYGSVKIQVVNEDNQSSIGKQDVVLLNVIFKTIPVTTIDDQSEDPVTVDVDFTFDDIQLLESFVKPINYR